MKRNKRLDFLKSIRLISEEGDNGKCGQDIQRDQVFNMTIQEEDDLQKKLERRFNEIFGSMSED